MTSKSDTEIDAGLSVRLALPSDAAEIARVHVLSWQTAYRGIVPQPFLHGLSVERRAGLWSRRLGQSGEPGESGGSKVWVAELGGAIVGFATAGPSADPEVPPGTGELEAIYLLPAAQGRGLGRRLLEEATRDLIDRGLAPLILWVLTANERARRFYEASGWEPDGAAKMLDFEGTQVEEIRYRRGEPSTPPRPT